QVRFIDERLGQTETLHHSLAEASDRLATAIGKPDALEQGFDPRFEVRRRHAGKSAVKIEQFGRGEIPRERMVLVHVPDAGKGAALVERFAETLDLAGSRFAK